VTEKENNDTHVTTYFSVKAVAWF